jgi:hypothetical protein
MRSPRRHCIFPLPSAGSGGRMEGAARPAAQGQATLSLSLLEVLVFTLCWLAVLWRHALRFWREQTNSSPRTRKRWAAESVRWVSWRGQLEAGRRAR